MLDLDCFESHSSFLIQILFQCNIVKFFQQCLERKLYNEVLFFFILLVNLLFY